MKKVAVILSLVFFSLFGGIAQAPERFNKSIDLRWCYDEWRQGMVVNDSSLVGTAIQFIDSAEADVLSYFKMDNSGNIHWKKLFPSPYRYSEGGGMNFQRAPNGDYLNCGVFLLDTINYSYESGKAFIMRLDSVGQMLWERSYRPSSDKRSHFHEFHIEDDGDIIAVGKSRSTNSTSSYDVYAVKTDPQGNVIWEQTYGGGKMGLGRLSLIKMATYWEHSQSHMELVVSMDTL